MEFKSKRPAVEKRGFTSPVIERVIAETRAKIGDEELGWLFENCFPNTLDTTVTISRDGEGRADTFVITGDIDAMWLRDSTNQVWPYVAFAKECGKLREMLRGLIGRQARCVRLDPYGNAFYRTGERESEWKSDHTEMKAGVHERKYELDSLASVLRLAAGYFAATGDGEPFDADFLAAFAVIVRTIRQEQAGSAEQAYPLAYSFQRTTQSGTETLALEGLGNPFRRCGMSRAPFRPSDDAAIFQYLIPSNAMAAVNLEKAAEMLEGLGLAAKLAGEARELAGEIRAAIWARGVVHHPVHGDILAYEIDGYSSHHLMDDANLPNLLSLPYLGFCAASERVYQNTRRFSLSGDNPYFAAGAAVPEGALGGPHIGTAWVWPLGIVTRAMTSTDEGEILAALRTLKGTHAGTGFMHEAFRVEDAGRFTRAWFAWANTFFGELILKVAGEREGLLRRV